MDDDGVSNIARGIVCTVDVGFTDRICGDGGDCGGWHGLRHMFMKQFSGLRIMFDDSWMCWIIWCVMYVMEA